ncbi:GTP cyclohydrolase II [Sphingomonas astaxanthinifaciens]|uniref:GTP cyclohydrolase-2 n=1 Tax=Sphingomonas astaxanthinifaciens DSM 22298 TaxID=1123267 RepID=A0ABQ5Z203_9SPHN|nr:GTP cyclohydrolase II [Sphingomonas astaxanthinifaciens]GLR46783.1 GTP cyclohydrolase-2 [Sphingomonas astaxanthinifaciens DSM 22298]
MSKAAAAIAALRAGRPVTVGSLTVVPVETATDALLAELDPDSRSPLLLSGARAAAIGLGNQREAASTLAPVLVERSDWLTTGKIRELVDPAWDFARFVEGPLRSLPVADPEAALGALTLSRLAGLVPAFWLLDTPAALALKSSEATSAARPRTVAIAARAILPVEGLEVPTQIVAMRAEEDGSEHVALVIGAPGGKPPLVRLHSECLTGDVFGSLKCDCGPQLNAALRLMEAEGSGILLYLRQEGRGIGLANKIRAYALQDRGLDTVEANRRLGFGDDERDFALAAAMLRALGVEAVRLLTNNPAKIEGLAAAGIAVTRVPHHLPANPHNADYLATKKAKSGHLD